MLARVPVLVAAGGAAWEAAAVREMERPGSGVVLLKRCVDLRDLLATASTGQARVALVAHGLPGLDADSVGRLRHAGLEAVMVTGPPPGADAGARAGRLGVRHLVPTDDLSVLVPTMLSAASEPGRRTVHPPAGEPGRADAAPPAGSGPAGRVVAVWGPAGAPGRTTVGVGLSAELASRGHPALLLDADAYGGAVAQHLGVLDEVSGILAAARAANAGELDPVRLGELARGVAPGLRVLTGLPRADRWGEVRDPAFAVILDQARALGGFVVVDTGFSLESDADGPFAGSAPQRNGMTLAALEQAEEVLVVGSADPVGLARLARGLVELLELVPGRPVRVVVNRARPSLGWGEGEVRAMVEGFVRPVSLHFLPDDRSAADRALVAGRSLVESGDSALRHGIAGLADAVLGEPPSVRRRRRLRR